jgi:hypothetical protein
MRLARLQFIDAISDYDNALARFQLIIRAAPSSAAAIAPAASASGAASAVQTKPAVHWAPGLLARAEQRLTEHVGPIARLLVSKAAGAAGNEAELYASLALAIPDAAERANFLRQFAGASAGNGAGGSVREATPGQSSRAIPQELLDKAGEVLIAHLGPMARLVVMNESREAKTPEDLFQRLLARIPSESEKAELLKKLRSLHPGSACPHSNGPRSADQGSGIQISPMRSPKMAYIRCFAVDKARRTCFEGTIDRDLYSFRRRSPVPRAR